MKYIKSHLIKKKKIIFPDNHIILLTRIEYIVKLVLSADTALFLIVIRLN
jgi:hypothetical protein